MPSYWNTDVGGDITPGKIEEQEVGCTTLRAGANSPPISNHFRECRCCDMYDNGVSAKPVSTEHSILEGLGWQTPQGTITYCLSLIYCLHSSTHMRLCCSRVANDATEHMSHLVSLTHQKKKLCWHLPLGHNIDA